MISVDTNAIAKAVAAEVAKQIPKQSDGSIPWDKRVMGLGEAAQYLGCSKSYLRDNLRAREDFPKPCSWAGEKRMGDPKWFAVDLEKWLRGNQR